MADRAHEANKGKSDSEDGTAKVAPSSTARKIPGNLPYLPGAGTLKRALDGMIEAQRPDKFNQDFLENVLKLTGGSARATIPILKRMGLLAADGTPTELYARFKTESGRGVAALQSLKNAFPEIFKRSEYAHSVSEAKLRDIIIEITGLTATDPIVGYIRNTFDVMKGFVGSAADAREEVSRQTGEEGAETSIMSGNHEAGISLAYNINIVLPETSDMTVLNAIFRSIKENLLK